MSIFSQQTVARLGSSKFNYWFGYISNIGLVLWLCSKAFADGHLIISPWRFAALACAGLLSWTFSEYVLHRYVYHVWPSFLSVGHDLHHRAPKENIGVPWYVTLVVVVALYMLLARLFTPVHVALIMAFNWLGYLGYCVSHHGAHHWPCKLPWLRQMKRHHMVHHAYPQTNWGFTTSLWDHVFGTYHRGRAYSTSKVSQRAVET